MATIKHPLIKAVLIITLSLLTLLCFLLISVSTRPLSTYPCQESRTRARLQKLALEYNTNIPNGYSIINRGNHFYLSAREVGGIFQLGPGYRKYFSLSYKRDLDCDCPEDWIQDSVIIPLLPSIERNKVVIIQKANDVTRVVRGLWDNTMEYYYCDSGAPLMAIADSVKKAKSGSIIRSGLTDQSFWVIYPYYPE